MHYVASVALRTWTCCVFYESETPMRIAMLRRRHRLRGLGTLCVQLSMLFWPEEEGNNVVIRV